MPAGRGCARLRWWCSEAELGEGAGRRTAAVLGRRSARRCSGALAAVVDGGDDDDGEDNDARAAVS